jgi:hypothetical protein
MATIPESHPGLSEVFRCFPLGVWKSTVTNAVNYAIVVDFACRCISKKGQRD